MSLWSSRSKAQRVNSDSLTESATVALYSVSLGSKIKAKWLTFIFAKFSGSCIKEPEGGRNGGAE